MMAIRVLRAVERPTEYHARMWLDTTKTQRIRNPDDPGDDETPNFIDVPDPAYVQEYSYAKALPQGLTKPQYLAMIKRELKALIQADLARREPVPADETPIPAFDGTDL